MASWDRKNIKTRARQLALARGYSQFFAEGFVDGYAEGYEQGYREGLTIVVGTVLRQINVVSETALEKIGTLSTSQLEILAGSVRSSGIEEINTWLNAH